MAAASASVTTNMAGSMVTHAAAGKPILGCAAGHRGAAVHNRGVLPTTRQEGEAWPTLRQFGEQSLRFQQILGVEPLGEPVVNRGEQHKRVLALALALPQSCEAG
jgi:hypothetical protein